MTYQDPITEAFRAATRAARLGPPQLSQDDLGAMSPQQITDARDSGQLDSLLGVPDDEIELKARATIGRLSIDDVKALAAIQRHDLIETARADQRIDYPNQEN